MSLNKDQLLGAGHK